MNTAAVFLVVAALAAVAGSLILYFGHRVRRPGPPDFQEQLRALAPQNPKRPAERQSGIVPYESGPEEEH
ncbi:MAG: hypothetical protein RIB98_13495 [Acidimicrobiales bacterium]